MKNKSSTLELSIRIWKDFYKDPTSKQKLREANELCKCFKIPNKEISQGKKIAKVKVGEKKNERNR